MHRIIMIGVCALVVAFLWRMVGLLSTDAIAMALGVLFGVLAGLPVSLLFLVGQRRTRETSGDEVVGEWKRIE